ncbi:MAG TPA: hypothetical protein VMZ91_14960 [Candidatus Paceibacterota bacterium]|nr:hypothetical protein [Candidatus Paceibacterota bacterium]
MNITRELEDTIEIFENRLKIATKLAYKSSDYHFGQCKSYKEIIMVLKDMKKRMDRDEKITKIEKSEKTEPTHQNILKRDELPIV